MGPIRRLLKRSPRLVALVRGLRQARAEIGPTIARLRLRKSEGYLLSAYGVWLRDRWHDKTYRYCVLGKYGYFYANWLRKQQDCLFLDVGANVGLYSLIASQNPAIRAVYAFEPVPETFAYLVDNLRRNQAQRVHPFPVGVSSESKELTILTKRDHSGVSTLRTDSLDHIGFDSEISISAVGPDYLDGVIDIGEGSRIAVKVDVEGHEPVVIDALMRSKLWPRVWNIYYEVNERYLDHQALSARLRSAGFETVHREGAGSEYNVMVQRVSQAAPSSSAADEKHGGA